MLLCLNLMQLGLETSGSKHGLSAQPHLICACWPNSMITFRPNSNVTISAEPSLMLPVTEGLPLNSRVFIGNLEEMFSNLPDHPIQHIPLLPIPMTSWAGIVSIIFTAESPYCLVQSLLLVIAFGNHQIVKKSLLN